MEGFQRKGRSSVDREDDRASARSLSRESATMAHHSDASGKEKEGEEQVVRTSVVVNDAPDGGFRAWLVVFGVSQLFSGSTSFFLMKSRLFVRQLLRRSNSLIFRTFIYLFTGLDM
jgi:hypothetical protein